MSPISEKSVTQGRRTDTPSLSIFLISILLIASLSNSAAAELHPMDDADLAQSIGQGVIDVTEIALGAGTNGADIDKSFTRITIGADISINANIDSLVLGAGTRQDGQDNSNGLAIADIDFANISLGTIGSNGNVQDLQITDPYVEFARNTSGDLVGIRLGFGEINGIMGINITTLSGDIQAVGELSLGLFNLDLNSSANKVREDDITDSLLGLNIDLGNFQNMKFTGTNNMYLGLQSEMVNYPKIGGGPQGIAQAGFWLNLQDGVTSPGLSIDSIIPISVSNDHPVNHFAGYY